MTDRVRLARSFHTPFGGHNRCSGSMWRAAAGLIGVLAVAMTVAACGSTTHPSQATDYPLTIAGVAFVPTSASVDRECRQTADAVKYAVPCPTLLPAGIAATPGVHGCRFQIVGWDRKRGCGAAKWHRWMVGSSQLSGSDAGPAGFLHLVVQGAPRIVRDPARAIDGPGMVPGSRVRSRGVVTIAGKRMRWYYVPPDRNQGSAFMHHLVLVWTADRHTYAYGFHVTSTFAVARALDLELVRHLVTVRPPAVR